MAKKGKSVAKLPPHYSEAAFKRRHRLTIQLNDKEMEAIELYCKKYKVKNKSGFVRESVLKSVMVKFLEDYPTLFEKQELDRLVVPGSLTE
ncbi:hypothetical protein ACT3CD_03695 [Geofilum sp. OHC36d9]|uniref:hypothetical protein n=1 Tax=Geofilum sp. OHC36d9 TaxID=3458413 RepID=UPI0040348F56